MWIHITSSGRAGPVAAVATAVLLVCPAAFCAADMAVDELSLEAMAEPGERYGGTIVVRNPGETTGTARVYQTDYMFFSDGSNVYGEPGELDRSNAEWITFGPRLLELPLGASSTIEYVVDVPADESLVGTYWSLIMVEEMTGTSPAGDAADGQVEEMKAGVSQVLRYAVQIVTHVRDSGTRTLQFGDKILTVAADGARVLHADVENTGERGLRPFLWVELYDSDGIRLGPYQSERKRLYPGTSVRYSVDLSEAPSGSYQAFVVVDNGDEYAFGAQYGLEF